MLPNLIVWCKFEFRSSYRSFAPPTFRQSEGSQLQTDAHFNWEMTDCLDCHNLTGAWMSRFVSTSK